MVVKRPETRQITIRVPVATMEVISKLTVDLSIANPHLLMTRSIVVRMLICEALNAHGLLPQKKEKEK
jgi:hypothetical protein